MEPSIRAQPVMSQHRKWRAFHQRAVNSVKNCGGQRSEGYDLRAVKFEVDENVQHIVLFDREKKKKKSTFLTVCFFYQQNVCPLFKKGNKMSYRSRRESVNKYFNSFDDKKMKRLKCLQRCRIMSRLLKPRRPLRQETGTG